MARVRMVTRTVEVTVAEVMCIDITTAQVEIRDFRITGKFADNNAILKHISKLVDENVKAVNVNSVTVEEVLYGMPEEDFIKLAQVLPPRTNIEE